MRKVWVLDTGTKGTGANVVPLEDSPKEPERAERRRRSPAPERGTHGNGDARGRAAAPRAGRRSEPPERRSGPLPPGHVRKKATGELGHVQSVDPRAGTAVVLWLRQGRRSTVPLTAISRR